MLKNDIKEKIIKKAISLEKYGIDDLAWNKEDAENLIIEIMQDRIGILGGEVYQLTSKHFEPLYDNWFCEQADLESEEDYYVRSKSESLTYIKNYPVQPKEKIVFSITFTEKIQ